MSDASGGAVPGRSAAEPLAAGASVLALHHDYRVRGGEEQAAATLAGVAEQQLGERVAWLRRSSVELGPRAAARGLLAGGTDPEQVTRALATCGADLLHAHNLFPTLGPRAVSAAAQAGAATVVHLHNSRLVCAVAVNVRDGAPCQECRAGRPLPGVIHRCRGSAAEAVAYGASLGRWRRGVLDAADAVIVPSRSAADRLRAMGVELPEARTHVVGGVAPAIADTSAAAQGRYALVAGRLAAEKDLRTAIAATALAGLPLVVAGDGPERLALEEHAQTAGGAAVDPGQLLGESLGPLPEGVVAAGHVVFVGHVEPRTLQALRRGARIGLVPSLAPETFGLAALELMAAAVPTIGSAVGALPEVLGAAATVPPADAGAMAEAITACAGDPVAGTAAAARAREVGGAVAVGARLAAAYAQARARRDARLADS